MTELSMGGATWQIDEKMKKFQNDKEIIDEIEKRLDEYMEKWEMDKLAMDFYIDVPDLSKYIKGVRVNPFAEVWYVSLIKQLCEEYKLNFDGQSELYTGY